MTAQKPTPERVELNAVVKAVAAKNRDMAVAILARFGGALTTPEIKNEDVEAARIAFVEALEKLNASATP